MYNISETVLQSILKKKFSSLTGKLCEKIENLTDESKIQSLLTSTLKSPKELKLFENAIKVVIDNLASKIKLKIKGPIYDTMRDIEDQIGCFSKGVNISVNLIKPTSDKV